MAFKMKNPFKQREVVQKYAEGKKHIGTHGRTPAELRALAAKALASGNKKASDNLLAQATRAEEEQKSAQKTLNA